ANPSVQQTEQKFNEAVVTNEKKLNETYDKVSATAQEELAKVKAEFNEFKARSGPKVQEAENFLTSPGAIGFYQGLVVGVFVVLGYAKYRGGLVL
ncbi:uncharacterized protein EV154DRAFT_494516, partial [Mucor mucedo]|uniref:uncharacterized protein n=1 Tax=Mucor mucedo TaxID=29922 RepID=UPI002220A4E5